MHNNATNRFNRGLLGSEKGFVEIDRLRLLGPGPRGRQSPISTSDWLIPDRAVRRGRFIYWEGRLTVESNRDRAVKARERIFPARTTTGGKDMLDGFIQLATASEQTIVDFAGKWGPLCMWRKQRRNSELRRFEVPQQIMEGTGWPVVPRYEWHCTNPLYMACVGDFEPESCPWVFVQMNPDDGTLRGREPIWTWRYWARRFAAAVRVWTMLGDGNSFASDRWQKSWKIFDESIFNAKDHYYITGEPGDLRTQVGRHFAKKLRDWMDIAHVGLAVIYGSTDTYFDDGAVPQPSVLHFEIATGTVFGALALQLAARLSGTAGFAVCSRCGTIYPPSRQPRAGSNNYCKDCRAQAPQEAMRRHRSRKRQQKMAAAKRLEEGKNETSRQ
jgi:hypothetical protein